MQRAHIPLSYAEVFNRPATPNFLVKIPLWCPLCNSPQKPILGMSHLFSTVGSGCYGVVTCQCTVCIKHYLEIYKLDVEAKTSAYYTHIPLNNATFDDELIARVSPRFIEVYSQALASEQNGHIDLAAMGFRNSLEILVKDYAINQLNEKFDDVKGLALAKAIEKYLNSDMVKAADVVRILGNDYAHYIKKYPQHDFEVLKEYMKIFISLVRVQLKINNPPVARTGNGNTAEESTLA